MLKYAIVFALISLVAALGFTGVAAGAAGIAKVLFVVFLILTFDFCGPGLQGRWCRQPGDQAMQRMNIF